MDDITAIKDIERWFETVRALGYGASLTCVEPKVRDLYPVFSSFETHQCKLCDLLKMHAPSKKLCSINKKIFTKSGLVSSSYNCCYFGIEEYIYPITYDNRPVFYVHVSNYRGKLDKSLCRFNFYKDKLGLPFDANSEYSKLSTKVPSKDQFDRILTPFKYMLTDFYRQFIATEPTPDDEPSLPYKISQYVTDNYYTAFSIDDMVKTFNYSASYIRRVFKNQYGITLAKYIKEYRLEQARTRLFSKRFSISEIAAFCGFTDPNHFAVLFKERYGLSPTEYRKTLSR